MKNNSSKFKDFDEYQKVTRKTAIYPTIGKKFIFPLVGLSGEVGEISEKIKKLFRDKNAKLTNEQRIEIGKEIGDAFWYLTQLSSDLSLNFSDIVKMNLEKISKRAKENKIHGDGDNR